MTESEDFERLRAARNPRRAYRVEDTPPELAKIFIAALDRIIDNKSSADDC
jgi:hypothetical protein